MHEKTLVAYQSTKDNPPIPLFKKQISGYKIYQLIPDRFIPDGKIVEEILLSISALRDLPLQIRDKCLTYCPTIPIYYEIFYEGAKVSFNYAIPEIYENILVNKIKSTYKSSTFLLREDYYNQFFNKSYCEFKPKKHFMFSLNVDYRENGLIESLLSLLHNIQGQDKLLLQVGILPLNENWKIQWKNAYERYKKGDNLDISKDIPAMVFDNTFKAINGLLSVLDMFMGQKHSEKETKVLEMNKFESYRHKNMTIQKITYSGFQIQIKMFCDNSENCYYYGKIVDSIFKILDADQELELGKIRINKFEERKFDFQVNKQIFSTKELGMFMQMPNRRMQIEFKNQFVSVENREIPVPESLRNPKGITIGDYTYRGEKQRIYLPSSKDNDSYSMLISGFQSVGKTSMMGNMIIEGTVKGHSSFVVDTIKNCELSNMVRDYMPESHKNKIIVLDYENMDWLLSLAWNESNIENGTNREKMFKASTLAGSFENFIDTVNATDDAERLSPKMKRILSSACRLVLQHNDSTIYDIILCLTDYERRHYFIDKSGLKNDSKIIQDMLMLDTKDNGTNYKEITGIIDRISILTNDMYMEEFLTVPTNPKINFQHWADNGYCVLLKIPEHKFSPVAISAMSTFLFTKIWLSILNRTGDVTNLPNVHIYADEIHKMGSSVSKLLYGWIREGRKYKTNFIISAHTLTDLKSLLPVFRASGANYMLFKSSPSNYKILENELLPYVMEELLETKPFHSVNVINSNREYSVFMTKAPDPVTKVYKYTDRSSLDLECSKKYGYEYKD